MIDNLTCLIMSKKIVLSVLLSLLFGILGAKASVGGFPVYRGFPYKGEAMDNGMWQWETTADDRIVCKINGTRLKRGWLCVFGDSERLCVELGGYGFSSEVFKDVKLPSVISKQTRELAKIVFSNGKNIQCKVIIGGHDNIKRQFIFPVSETNDTERFLSMLMRYDVKKLIIGSNVFECQTSTKETFSAMLDEWYEKFSGNDFKPTYSGGEKSNTVDAHKLRKNIVIRGTTQSLDMVFVQGGTFSFKDQGTKNVNSFYIGRTEVTQKVWKAVMKTNSSAWKGDNLPVTNVTYWQALEFCKKLSRLTGKKFRLPKDVEWEFAARGGIYSKGYKYPGSDNPLEVGWLCENSNSRLHVVAQKKPNELGLYDMWGNCKEMCSEYIYEFQPEYKRLPGAYRRARGCDWGSSYDNSFLKDDVIMAFDRKYGRDDCYQQGFGTAEVGLRLVMEP